MDTFFYGLFSDGIKYSIKEATLKGKNLLPEGSELFPLSVDTFFNGLFSNGIKHSIKEATLKGKKSLPSG